MWQKFPESKPEIGKPYLVRAIWHDDPFKIVAVFDGETWIEPLDDRDIYADSVTHFMELPLDP